MQISGVQRECCRKQAAEYFNVGLQRCTVDCGTLCNEYCELRHPAPKTKQGSTVGRLWGQGAGLSPLICVCVCGCVVVS